MKKTNLSFVGSLIINGSEIQNIPCEIAFPETQDTKPTLKAKLDKIGIPPYVFPFHFGLTYHHHFSEISFPIIYGNRINCFELQN